MGKRIAFVHSTHCVPAVRLTIAQNRSCPLISPLLVGWTATVGASADRSSKAVKCTFRVGTHRGQRVQLTPPFARKLDARRLDAVDGPPGRSSREGQ
jgi:hypothetical protein